ncbi:hypothetical protein NU08_3474 [Flavobacterium anhuiense]|uniref:Uncharacterized protein n=1 Tax=Flavobacterium anhuiense TaxID=459526 RepID=A0A444VUV9_9FLAO|nr:hypothetical protein NU08_3474 [Flavobacterium anhuiense]
MLPIAIGSVKNLNAKKFHADSSRFQLIKLDFFNEIDKKSAV